MFIIDKDNTQFKLNYFYQFISGECLNLARKDLASNDIKEILCFLQQHPNIKTLDLSLNCIDDLGLSIFAEANLTVDRVNFYGNNISDEGIVSFAQKNQTVTHADFSQNIISHRGIAGFAENNQVCHTARFSVLKYH